MNNESIRPKPQVNIRFSTRTRIFGVIGILCLGFWLFVAISLQAGGHMMGPTYVEPGNVGLVIDNYKGYVERDIMPAGLHWQGPWESVIEVPTAQRTISLTRVDPNIANGKGPVQVNTVSNMLVVDVSVQYQIQRDRARDLYASFQDQFTNINNFENVNIEPAIKGAINYAIGDMDTTTALTTVGKQHAEQNALAALNEEWQPRGIVFSNLMIRAIQQDAQSQQLLSTTLGKMQEIENAKLSLQQQKFDNMTIVSTATAQAKVDRLQNSTLTDLYLQDQLLSKVKTLYMSSDQIMGALKK